VDPQLRTFLEAKTDAEAASALDRLLAGPLSSVIGDTVRRELAGSLRGAEHGEDIAADVRLRIIRKLMWLRGDDRARAAGEGIANIAGYASVTAERACYAFLRRQFPERTRFRNRVRYVLSRHPQITFESGADGVWRASTRVAVRAAPAAGTSVAFLQDPGGWLHRAGVDQAQPLAALVPALLSRLDRAIEFDRLVNALAAALGIAEAGVSRGADRDDARDEPADPAPAIADVLEQRESLERTWREIVELPPRQRAALLLNLRDPDGGAVLQMLPATGVVSAASIAAALEISPAELAALWPRLPLDDLAIADELGLTRQQVINLRKSARARLARRLREKRP
jgi:DNA-directed RNA polymerase specialized sigma24 family protein